VLLTAAVAYLFVLAAQSPTPWLIGLSVICGSAFYSTTAGPLITVGVCIVLSALLSYTRTELAQTLRDSGGDEKTNENRLFWCGVATQAGSFVGAFTIFPIVSVAHLFNIAQPCQQY